MIKLYHGNYRCFCVVQGVRHIWIPKHPAFKVKSPIKWIKSSDALAKGAFIGEMDDLQEVYNYYKLQELLDD